MKPVIVLIADPDESSPVYNASVVQEEFRLARHIPSTREALLAFLREVEGPVVAFYAGFMAFTALGGLTRETVEHRDFPRETLRCIAVCSRGVNGFDLDALRDHGIRLYNYADDGATAAAACTSVPAKRFQAQLLGNDAADCALWHVLEGFRKLSYFQQLAREHGLTGAAREAAAQRAGFQFGHMLANGGLHAESPRGKRALVLGLGSIGRQVALKLQHGLGMDVHYAKRTPDPDARDWQFHKLDASLHAALYQFHVIVVALPGTEDTRNLVNEQFLAHCNGPELILVNVGRGFIIDMDIATTALEEGQLRHLGVDVFTAEPQIDQVCLSDKLATSVTPHIATATREYYEQSCDLAWTNILRALGKIEDLPHNNCRVV